MKSLPWPEHFSRVFVLLGLFASAASCDNDNTPTLSGATTQFTESAATFSENGGEQTITIVFDHAAPVDGEIVVKTTAIVPSCYTTNPVSELNQLKIAVAKGETQKTFKMTPTDNSNLDGVKVVKFTITSVSDGFIAGNSKELTVSVTDDEAPVVASFETTKLNVRENTQDPGKVEILLSRAAPADGVLVVKLQSTAVYGVAYSTQPEVAGGKIFLPVPKGSSSVSIDVYPVNDQDFHADRNINFEIIDATGGVATVEESESLRCTITEDDGHQITNIVSIRSMFVDEPIVINEDTYVEGIVTSVENTLGGRVVVEDETGALPIQLLSDNKPTRGDIVLVNIKGSTLHELQGTLEASQVPDYEKLGKETIYIDRISLEDLLGSTRRMESRTVQLIGLTFTQADGSATLLGDRLLSDGQRTIIIRTGANADFADNIIPSGPVIVTGIFTECDGLYVIYPQESKDVKKQGVVSIKPGLKPSLTK